MKKIHNEDAPTNATGSAVVGTGDDKTTWKRKKKKSKIVKRLKATYEVGRKPDKNLVIKKEEKGSPADREKLLKLYNKAFKSFSGSPKQKEIKKEIDALRKKMGLTERNYRKEYDNYHAQPEQREKNAARLRARRLMVKKGKVKKNDKMDVHHKDNNPLNNDTKNLSVVTQKYNRTEPRLREEGEQTPMPDFTPDSTFASMPVFKVNQDDFSRCQDGKKKHAHWNKHIDTESDYGKKIHGYAKKNPKQSIIVQDDKTGHMVYLKKYSQLEK
jgi:hypothetical protein